MKTFACACWVALALAIATPSGAQTPAADTLEAVEAERTQLQTESARAEAACYERFAVNACLADVAAQRRARATLLRKREIVIRDAQRAERARDQLRVLDEKAAEQQQRALDAGLAAPVAPAIAKSPPTPQKAGTSGVRADKGSALTSEEVAANRAAFDAKQEEAARHRADLEKRLQEKKDRADPLPVSP